MKQSFSFLLKKTVWWTWNCEKDTSTKTPQETVTSYLKLPLCFCRVHFFHAALLAAWNLFLPSTIALFNSLPSSVVSCSSKSGFTRALDRHFSSDKFSFGLSWPSFRSFFLFFFCFFFSSLFFPSVPSLSPGSSLYLFSLPRNFFTLVFIVYYLAILVKHINKQTNKQTLKLGLRSFVFLFFFPEKMFLNNGYQTAAEKCCVPEHRENLNDWYARKHVHGCKLREITVHAYFGCFHECLPLVYERCFSVGQMIYALVRAWKINSTTTTVHISWAYFWWMFSESLHTLAEEAKIPWLFFSHECFTEM